CLSSFSPRNVSLTRRPIALLLKDGLAAFRASLISVALPLGAKSCTCTVPLPLRTSRAGDKVGVFSITATEVLLFMLCSLRGLLSIFGLGTVYRPFWTVGCFKPPAPSIASLAPFAGCLVRPTV